MENYKHEQKEKKNRGRNKNMEIRRQLFVEVKKEWEEKLKWEEEKVEKGGKNEIDQGQIFKQINSWKN